MRLTEIVVDLALPETERWGLGPLHLESAAELLHVYNRDLGVDEAMLAELAAIAEQVIPPELLLEMSAVASLLGVALPEVLVANLHYDMLKAVLGCTGFALDTQEGPIHARNLDWWTPARTLNEGTVVSRFVNGPAGDFFTVGWPGLVGAFSGVASNRFAVTLNAVLSDEPMQIARPVVMLIREVLQYATSFDDAVGRLSGTNIATDCLLLVTGTKRGEMVVVERTPTRSAHRYSTDREPLRLANAYVSLDAPTGESSSELTQTSCARYERLGEMLRASPPKSLRGCISLLSGDGVKMGITVQQMAFRAATGELLVQVP